MNGWQNCHSRICVGALHEFNFNRVILSPYCVMCDVCHLSLISIGVPLFIYWGN